MLQLIVVYLIAALLSSELGVVSLMTRRVGGVHAASVPALLPFKYLHILVLASGLKLTRTRLSDVSYSAGVRTRGSSPFRLPSHHT